MRANSLKKIENQLLHSKNVLLILDDKKSKPQKKDINLLQENVSKLTTRTNLNRSTKRDLEKNEFCLVLNFKNGFFVPAQEF